MLLHDRHVCYWNSQFDAVYRIPLEKPRHPRKTAATGTKQQQGRKDRPVQIVADQQVCGKLSTIHTWIHRKGRLICRMVSNPGPSTCVCSTPRARMQRVQPALPTQRRVPSRPLPRLPSPLSFHACAMPGLLRMMVVGLAYWRGESPNPARLLEL